MSPVTTCRHLVSRRRPTDHGRWYPGCALGDTAARQAWVDAVNPVRLAAIARLRREMAGINARFIDQLWSLKAQQLQTRRDYGEEGPIDRQLRHVGGLFIEQTQQFLQAHEAQLSEIDVSVDAIVHLLRLSIERLVAQSAGEVRWEIPEEALAQCSPPVRLFFRPPAPARVDASHPTG
jgi:hypothetical protein